MYTHQILVTPYNGSVLAANLLSPNQTLALNSFGTAETGTLSDDDGVLSDYDDGLSTYNGHPINYLGTGTATPGVDVLGATVATGAAVPLVVFEANGSIYFHFPQGEPNLLGSVALVVDLDPVSSTIFTPVCFAAGTVIGMVGFDRPVERIKAGDKVLDWFGEEHEVLWCGRKRLRLPSAAAYDKWRPVRIAAGAFGAGKPDADTWVSQQHRIYFDGLRVTLFCGEEAALAPAKQLINGQTVCLDHERREVEYWHILCRNHVILTANGMPAESLLTVADPANGEHRAIFDEMRELFGGTGCPMQMAVPEATPQAARVLAGLRAY